MKRRHFLGLAFGLVAGAALTGSAMAAPLVRQPLAGSDRMPAVNNNAQPAVTSTAEVDQIEPEQVHWGHHRRWHGRHWGWRRHHWHRHHWRRHW